MTAKRSLLFLAAFSAFFSLLPAGFGQAFRTLAGFNEQIFAGNDDDAVGPISPGFNLNFFGQSFSELYINNNGNVSFGAPFGAFTPAPIPGLSTPVIAPFFADVDTTSGNVVTYGTGTLGGFNAFVVNWLDVNVFGIVDSPKNSFQLVLIDRSDTGAGNFDFEFNYTQILWEAGSQSGGNSRGLGGTTARIGYTNGAGTSYELLGSGVSGYFLDKLISPDGTILTSDDNPTRLIAGSLGTPFDGPAVGRYSFQARSNNVPEQSTTLILAVISLATMASVRRWSHF